MKKLEICAIKQNHPNNCWAACLSMALVFFSKPKSEEVLNTLFEANNEGLDLLTLNSMWDEKLNDVERLLIHPFNEDSTKQSMSFEEIKSCINSGHPIIIGVYGYECTKAHALLVVGYKDDSIIFNDPMCGSEITMKFSDLESKMSDYLIVKG